MTLALDIGGTNIRIANVSKTQVKDLTVIPNPKNKHDLVKSITKLIDQHPKPKSLGIGIAGFVKDGVILNSPNMKNMKNLNLASILKKRYKCSVYIENDANCAGLAELYYGAGKGKKNIILLTLGTGVGGAIIIDGKLYKGNGFAGEPGHMQINGKQLEAQASGTAATLMGKKCKIKCLNAIDVEVCALQGNKKAIKIYKDIGKTLGEAILNMSYLIDPDVFILGGGFARAPFILEEIHKVTKHEDILKRNLKIVKAQTGVKAGLIGAALLTR